MIYDDMSRKTEYTLKSNEEIQQAVEDAFIYDPRINSFDISVEVADLGSVTLSGTVDNLRAKRAAEQDAKDTIGVYEVTNNLKVRPVDEPADKQIEENIENVLRYNPIVDRFDITVDVRNRKAYLYGNVDTYYEATEAEEAAESVYGVVEVGNHLEAQSYWTPKSDDEIREDVATELYWSPFVDRDNVEISVDEGTVTLEGTVINANERDAAIDNAFDAGAQSVVSQLKIADAPGVYPRKYVYPPYIY
jgi:osmotically-inducible protein OsmY